MSDTCLPRAVVRQVWIDRDVTLRDAAQALGVSVDAVRLRAQAMGLPDRRATRISDDAVRAVWADASITTGEAALRIGLTRSNLWRRAKALGLPARPKGHPRIGDRALFAAMWGGGVSLAEIGTVFGITACSVSDAAGRFGLPRRKAGHRPITLDQFRADLMRQSMARAAAAEQAALVVSEMVDVRVRGQRRAA